MQTESLNIPPDWQEKLANEGHFFTSLVLPDTVKTWVAMQNWPLIDDYFMQATSRDGIVFGHLKQFSNFNEIEFIISLRDSENEWEEDGIWHDDGSRVLAFSLSLTLEPKLISGGVLEIRKKGASSSFKIPPFAFGEMVVFATGTTGHEHKINRVTNGKRLIIAGWCR
jgi:hypothetical protein